MRRLRCRLTGGHTWHCWDEGSNVVCCRCKSRDWASAIVYWVGKQI